MQPMDRATILVALKTIGLRTAIRLPMKIRWRTSEAEGVELSVTAETGHAEVPNGVGPQICTLLEHGVDATFLTIRTSMGKIQQ